MKRTVWLCALLCAGCAMLPAPTLEPAQIRYSVRTDWDGVPLEGGERVFETDLGYTVGIHTFEFRTTSIELVPCPEETAWLDLGPARAYAHGGAYDHDISVVEPGVLEDLMEEQEEVRGEAEGTRSAYCELFSVHGTGRDELVASVIGWYRAPGSNEDVPFVAEHPLGVTHIAPLEIGDYDDALLPDQAEVVVTSFPARAFNGIELDAIPTIDLAYELSQALLQTREVRWTIAPPRD